MSITINDGQPINRWNYMSAYAIAVKHGYRGTEAEWLADVYGGAASAKTDAESAAASAEAAAASEETADARALDSEAYAVGKRGGEDVGEGDPAYHNNSKYYAESVSARLNAQDEEIDDVMTQVAAVRQQVDAPFVTASNAAAMTDTTKAYVYVGSEAGYVQGSWYYWDGDAWTLGGMSVDDSLSVEGAPADAAAVGTVADKALIYRGQLSSLDDINDTTFAAAGQWYAIATAASKPANWPLTDNVAGRLIVFGTNTTGMAERVQLAFNHAGEFAWRVSISLADGWSDWQFVAPSTALDEVASKALLYRGQLTSADDVDNKAFTVAGQWYAAGTSSSKPANWPLAASTAGRLVVFGSYNQSMAERVQLAINHNGEFAWRVSISNADGWSDWQYVAQTQRGYVAIGASTSLGSDGDGNYADTTYPMMIARFGNFKLTNLAVGYTDFVKRQTSSSHNNYMDVLTDPDNAAALAAADLITVWVGVNDQDAGVATGEYDDYYAYTGEETSSQLYANCTKAGAMNFVIKYVSENFPNAQLVFIVGPCSPRYADSASVSDGKVVYTPSSNRYAQEVAAMARQVCAAAVVPVADCADAFSTVWNGATVYKSATNRHPRLTYYRRYNQAIAAAVLAKYRN